VVIIPTDSVRKAIAVYGIKREMNRPEYSTKGFTITVADLFKVASRRRQSASQSQST